MIKCHCYIADFCYVFNPVRVMLLLVNSIFLINAIFVSEAVS